MRAGAMLHSAPLPPDESFTPFEHSVAPPRPVVERRPVPVLSPLPTPAPTEEPEPAAVPAQVPVLEPPPIQPAHRRAARYVLRLLRPLTLPFLHRLDWRIRGAVDRTETSAAVARIEAALATLAVRMEAANAANTALLDAAYARVAAVDASLAARLDALETARLGDHAELLRAVAEARVPDEVFAGIVLRLDAARLQIRDAGASAAAVAGEAIALLQSLHPKADDLGVQVAALHAKTDQAGLDRAVLLARNRRARAAQSGPGRAGRCRAYRRRIPDRADRGREPNRRHGRDGGEAGARCPERRLRARGRKGVSPWTWARTWAPSRCRSHAGSGRQASSSPWSRRRGRRPCCGGRSP